MSGILQRLRTSTLLRRFLRIFQFLSATTSLILFSIRLAKIIRLTKRATASNGAVEGILAAAVAYTIAATLLQLCLRGGGPKILRYLLIIFDIIFVGAFIAVAVETSPKGNRSSGPCTKSNQVNNYIPNSVNCKLPWGTFILAIVSTLLHALTAAFHEVRDHHSQKMQNEENGIEREGKEAYRPVP